jgi:hypothetical protein
VVLTLIEEEETIGHSGSENPSLREDVNRGGRPTDYRPEFAEAARKYSLLGVTNKRIGELLGVTRQTVDNWLRDIPEFREAIFDGRDRADAEIAASMYRRAKGYDVRVVRREVSRRTDKKGELIEEHTRVIETTTHFPPEPGIGAKWLMLRHPEWQTSGERPLTVDDILAIAEAARAEQARRQFDLAEFGQDENGEDPAARPN